MSGEARPPIQPPRLDSLVAAKLAYGMEIGDASRFQPRPLGVWRLAALEELATATLRVSEGMHAIDVVTCLVMLA